MDGISVWLHDLDIDQALDSLGKYVDTGTRVTLLRFLIDEESRLGRP